MYFLLRQLVILTSILCLPAAGFLDAAAKPNKAQEQIQTATAENSLTEEGIRQFLLTAKVVGSKQTSKGITHPFRLTLSDGRLTHDAGFQSVDIYKAIERMDRGVTEINFRDSYHFNIAAYELGRLLGLGYMMPVTVERRWQGKTGSLSWWLKVKMDSARRNREDIQPPDPKAWNEQVYRMRVFSQLIYDTDRNQSNLLIGENWELYMIDFSRAFRLHKKLQNPDELTTCDRQLLEKLRRLDAAEVERVTKPHLRKGEIDALMARRDLIVALFRAIDCREG